MKMKKVLAMAMMVVMLFTACAPALALSSGAAGLRDNPYRTGTREQAKEYSFGFGRESLLGGNWTWPVYSAPSMDAFRAAGGKASVHMEDDVYSGGWSGAWLLIRYPKVTGGFRVGWVPKSEINRPIERTRDLEFAYWTVSLNQACALTDDPLYESDVIAYAEAGEELTYLAYYQYNGGREYAYVQGELNGKPICGFVPFEAVSF